MLRCIFLDNNIIAGLRKCIKTQIKVHGIAFGDPCRDTCKAKANPVFHVVIKVPLPWERDLGRGI